MSNFDKNFRVPSDLKNMYETIQDVPGITFDGTNYYFDPIDCYSYYITSTDIKVIERFNTHPILKELLKQMEATFDITVSGEAAH